jgi:uncharacterized protein (DUF305 family)
VHPNPHAAPRRETITGTTRPPAAATAALFAALALAACGGATRGATLPAPAPVGEQGTRSAVARARADSARYPYTAADVRFMTAMVGHHAQAVTIARWAPTHGASAAVRTLAERIVNGQQDEIGTMQRWLADRGQPVPDPPRAGPAPSPRSGQAPSADSTRAPARSGEQAHAGHAMPHEAPHEAPHETGHQMGGMAMPGMLTEAQLRQLDAARGGEFDRLFLTFMIQHHRGATAMVQALFGTPGAGQDDTVFKFASDVNVDQTTEIARMQKMLADLTFGPASP